MNIGMLDLAGILLGIAAIAVATMADSVRDPERTKVYGIILAFWLATLSLFMVVLI